MDGFYSIWSKPYLIKNNTDKYWMHDYDLLTMILSVCQWQKCNGDALLIADQEALDFLDSKKLLPIFKSGYKCLPPINDIDTDMFWAAGKLYALNMLDKPRVMIDLDLIIWKDISELLSNKDIVVIHREELNPDIYPDFELFEVNESFAFDKEYDKTVLPCNTAMLYIDDMDFLHKYCETSIDFMKNTIKYPDNLCRMVFAEQRLISILAKKYNKNITSAFPLASDIGIQDTYTHIWGHKNILRFNYEERVVFCKKIMKRLKNEYNDVYSLVASMYEMKDYIDEE